MAIYHLSVKTISRSAGRSATAAAAYRAGVEITDERTGEIHDYTRKGGVESAELVLPAGAPEWAADRAALWNAAEQAETRKNSTVAREFEVALPEELSPAERARLARDFARELVERHGCAADVAIHAPGKEGDNRNHHAHILLSTRRLGPEGFTEKTRELDDQKTGSKLVTQWRERFAALTNERLRENGIEARVDHRTLEAQGIEREPTRHLGPAATGYERRTGEPSRKRLDFEQEAAERLARAREAGELERQGKAADRAILDLTGELEAAKRERAERQAREAREREQADRQRLERMSSRELAAEIAKLRPPPVRELVERDPAVIEADRQRRALEEQHQDARTREAMARHEAEQWRQAHPLRAKAHDAGLFRSAYLDERAQIEAEARQEWLAVAPRIEDAALRGRQARSDAEVRITVEQTPIRAKVAELEALQKERARQEREAEAKRLAQQRIEREREAVPKDFKLMAQKREMKMGGWGDRGDGWKAAPEPLKKLIESYNATPKAQRQAVLDHMMANPKTREHVRELLAEQRQNGREQGLSLG
ncbi:MobA/MobL family protein [Crenobacter luteus]|uniref:MobQ family relaxase n=1 Tax=Crenobacter luteus TaxID=1452487 RepID=UPI001044EFCE|nr:MobQ family relaxase [Crenobacter luteus]TCP07376.1 MobA/MobL family protein [Crenobacter luteus]